MASKMESIVKDYLFIAILLGFLVYKLPGSTQFINGTPTTTGIGQIQEKESLLRNSVFQSGVRLLDIKLQLDNNLLDKSGDLTAHIGFDSFGNVPTLINLDYVITDPKGMVVYEETGEISVETENSITKTFKNLNLRSGKYTLTLNTLYNTNVRDTFSQSFEIKGPSPLEIVSWIIVSVALIGMVGSIIYRLVKPKDKEEVKRKEAADEFILGTS